MPRGPEQDFQDKIVDLGHVLGWRFAHWRPLQTKHGWRTACEYDAEGFPDLIGFHPSGDVVAAELKTVERRNEWGTGQREWLDLMNRGPVDAHLWTPPDFDDLIVPRLDRWRSSRG